MSYPMILLALYGAVTLIAVTPFLIRGWVRRNHPVGLEPEELEAMEAANEARRFQEYRRTFQAANDMEAEVEIVSRARQMGIDPYGSHCNLIRMEKGL